MNLPIQITFPNGIINYLYNAAGQKVSKTVDEGDASTTTDYLSGFQYKDARLQFFPHAEGYVNVTESLQLDGPGQIYHYVFNYTDHLGNIRLSYSKDPVNNVVRIMDENHYYPFGLKHTGYNSDQLILQRVSSTLRIVPIPPLFRTSYKYKYNGKELQDELGLNMYDYGARNYDSALGRWMNIDPLAEKTQELYSYVWNNPVMNIDPDGRSGESTIVKDLGDGKYEVVGGDANDGDKGIYVDDGKGGKGEKIGESITSHSFFDPKEKAVLGAIIDTKSNDGQKFIDKLVKDNPSLVNYMLNALGGEKYDFKTNNIDKRGNQSELQYMYRGSVDENGNIGSARDYGNIGAGLVAARKGYTWQEARVAFDVLETAQESTVIPVAGKPIPVIRPSFEGKNTVKAQMVGFAIGLQRYRR